MGERQGPNKERKRLRIKYFTKSQKEENGGNLSSSSTVQLIPQRHLSHTLISTPFHAHFIFSVFLSHSLSLSLSLSLSHTDKVGFVLLLIMNISMGFSCEGDYVSLSLSLSLSLVFTAMVLHQLSFYLNMLVICEFYFSFIC